MGKYPMNGTHYTEADDLEMLSTPADWPGILHVKRGHPAKEHGTVVVNGAPRGRLVLVRGGDSIAYEDAAAMVADGWRVD